jgi:membrane protein
MGRVEAESVAEARTGIRPATVAREVARQALRDDVLGLSAELAYRFFIALFPFFIFLTALGAVASSEFGVENPARRAVELIGDVVPREGAQFLEDQLRQVIENAGRGHLLVGGLLAIIVATSGTNAIIKGLNRTYGVREHRPFWKRYLTALVLTVAAGTASVIAILVFVPFRLAGETPLLTNVVVALVALALLVAAVTLLFRIGPNIKLPLRVVLPGAALFAGAWLVAAIGFSFYVSNFADYASSYGVLAGVVIVLVWFYLMALTLLLSAEANQVIHAMSDPEDMAYRRREAVRDGEDDFHPSRELGVTLEREKESDPGAAAS